jgi:hypothetical protein
VVPVSAKYIFIFLPQGGKKGGILGVGDSKLSASINEALDIKCSHIGVIPEVTSIY